MNLSPHLQLRHIRCFLEIARLESVSQAADQLNITQPAVSKSLKELETALDVALFDRVGRRLRLNENGRIFQAHASASMIELMRAQDRLLKDVGDKAQLSIGVLPTSATDLVPQAALTFHTEYPDTRVHVITGPNWLLYNQLRDGNVDLVVGRMPLADQLAGISFAQLYLEEVVLVVRPGHTILEQDHPEAEIARYEHILPPPGAVIAGTVERYLSSIGLPGARGAFETVALPVGRRIVQKSDMLWFISRGVVADELAQGTLAAVNLGNPMLAGPVGISVSESAPLRVARSRLIDHLRLSARAMRDQGSGLTPMTA